MGADIKKDINLLNTRKHLKRNSLVFLLEPKGSKVLAGCPIKIGTDDS